MIKERILIAAICLSLLSFGVAEAQANSRSNRGISVRTNKAPAPRFNPSRSNRISAPARVTSSRSPIGRSSNGRRGVGSNTRRGPGAPSLGNLNRGLGGLNNNGPLGGLLQDYLYNEYGGRGNYDPYSGQKAQAKAYRDAAIANAVVNVVGILATTHQQRQYAQYNAAPAPSGHVERQQILVHEGRVEEYRVWIPEYVIPKTGEVVVGHHETRRREVAPVYETREVWVPSR